MAKAILGHLSATDPRVVDRVVAENRRLRQRVGDLEAQIVRLQAENDLLAATAAATVAETVTEPVDGDRLLSVPQQMQPA